MLGTDSDMVPGRYELRDLQGGGMGCEWARVWARVWADSGRLGAVPAQSLAATRSHTGYDTVTRCIYGPGAGRPTGTTSVNRRYAARRVHGIRATNGAKVSVTGDENVPQIIHALL